MGKRIFDFVFALSALCLAAPFFLLCILIVKCSSLGPVFYTHPRVGQQGKPFGCLKFRTMYPNADTRLTAILAANPALMSEWRTYFKLKADPRITPIGQFLRRTSLDELPQLINVLKGEMSVVGPRPLTAHEIAHYVKEKAPILLSVKPGLTSLWITEGRNGLSLEERIAREEYYVLNRTFWLDCKVIGKTILRMIFPKGAY